MVCTVRLHLSLENGIQSITSRLQINYVFVLNSILLMANEIRYPIRSNQMFQRDCIFISDDRNFSFRIRTDELMSGPKQARELFHVFPREMKLVNKIEVQHT